MSLLGLILSFSVTWSNNPLRLSNKMSIWSSDMQVSEVKSSGNHNQHWGSSTKQSVSLVYDDVSHLFSKLNYRSGTHLTILCFKCQGLLVIPILGSLVQHIVLVPSQMRRLLLRIRVSWLVHPGLPTYLMIVPLIAFLMLLRCFLV